MCAHGRNLSKTRFAGPRQQVVLTPERGRAGEKPAASKSALRGGTTNQNQGRSCGWAVDQACFRLLGKGKGFIEVDIGGLILFASDSLRNCIRAVISAEALQVS